MTYEQQFIEEKIIESLKEVMETMERELRLIPEFTGYIYEGIYDEAIKYSSLPAKAFKKSNEPAFYVALNGRDKTYLTNWQQRPFLNHFLRSMKWTDYKYKDDYYSDYFPAQAEFSLHNLTIWALKKLTSPNQVKKGIIGVTNTFAAIISKSPVDYYNVIIKSKDEVLNDTFNNFENSPIKEIIYFRISLTNHYVVLSETAYLYIAESPKSGPTGTIVESGTISDNATIKILDERYEASPQGMETLEISLFGECTFNRIDVRQEIDKRLKKMKPKK